MSPTSAPRASAAAWLASSVAPPALPADATAAAAAAAPGDPDSSRGQRPSVAKVRAQAAATPMTAPCPSGHSEDSPPRRDGESDAAPADADQKLRDEVQRICLVPEWEEGNFCRILDLPDSDPQPTVQTAEKKYRELMRVMHPDKRTAEGERLAGGRTRCEQALHRVQRARERAQARLQDTTAGSPRRAQVKKHPAANAYMHVARMAAAAMSKAASAKARPCQASATAAGRPAAPDHPHGIVPPPPGVPHCEDAWPVPGPPGREVPGPAHKGPRPAASAGAAAAPPSQPGPCGPLRPDESSQFLRVDTRKAEAFRVQWHPWCDVGCPARYTPVPAPPGVWGYRRLVRLA